MYKKMTSTHSHKATDTISALEILIIEADALVLKGALEAYRKNFISAAHTLRTAWKKYKLLQNTLIKIEVEGLVKVKANSAGQTASDASTTDQKSESVAAQRLASLIEEKTKEIRARNIDRHAVVSESLLEATNELIRLKQLYKDLTGTWKSSDQSSSVQQLQLATATATTSGIATTGTASCISQIQVSAGKSTSSGTTETELTSKAHAEKLIGAATSTNNISRTPVSIIQSEINSLKQSASAFFSHIESTVNGSGSLSVSASLNLLWGSLLESVSTCYAPDCNK
jgi:hypothetical protein